ncbi:MAG: hypothetical protein EON55_17400, partial [Alphaproteobacteria bacterium]
MSAVARPTVTRKGSGPALFAAYSAKPFSRVRGNPGATNGTLHNSASRPRANAWLWIGLAILLALFLAMPAFAQAVPAPTNPAVGDAVDRALGQLGGQAAGNTGQSGSLSLSLQVLIIMGLLTILPGILLMMTSFTRIIIVLAILRQALGLQQTPPNQVLLGLSLFLSFFIMAPTISQINTTAIQPYAAGQLAGTQMITTAGVPLHAFMVKQTRIKDVT